MKKVGLRLAAAAVAVSLCFGASARAHVPALSTPSESHSITTATTPKLIPTTVVALATLVVAVTRAVSSSAVDHSQVNPVAQFDATR